MRIGIAGVGRMGTRHLVRLIERADVDVVAIADPDAEALRGASRLFENAQAGPVPRLFQDGQTMLAGCRMAAVVIATPADSHAALTLCAVAAATSVLVEKPLSAHIDDCETVVAAVSAAPDGGRAGFAPIVQVGHIERFNPAVQAALSAVQSGLVGRVLEIRAVRRGPNPKPDGYAGLGAAFDLAVHDVDVACELMRSAPLSVSASAGATSGGASPESWIVGSLVFDGGITARVKAEWSESERSRRLVVSGEMGTLEVDYLAQTLSHVTRGAAPRHLRVEPCEPIVREHDAFISAVRQGGPSPVSAADGMRAVRIVTAMLAAARSRSQVSLAG